MRKNRVRRLRKDIVVKEGDDPDYTTSVRHEYILKPGIKRGLLLRSDQGSDLYAFTIGTHLCVCATYDVFTMFAANDSPRSPF